MPRETHEKVRSAFQGTVIFAYWLQVPLFFGLVITLVLFAGTFFYAIFETIRSLDILDRSKAILLVLDLLDMIFIANLIAMVMVSGYNTYFAGVARDDHDDGSYLKETDGFSAMKPRIAGTMVIISAIHLLHEVMDEAEHSWQSLLVLTGVHIILLATAAMFMLLGRDRRTGERSQ